MKKLLGLIFLLLPQGKKVGLPGVNVFDVHTTKACKRMKVVLLHLFWCVNVKTIGGFICISFGDFHIDNIAQ